MINPNYPVTSQEFVVTPFSSDGATMDTIADLHLQLRYWQREQGQNQFRTNIHASQTDLSAIDSFYLEPGGNFFVANRVADGAVAGFVGLKREDEYQAQLKRLAVMPDYHRRGIGSLLVGTAVEWARDTGLQKLVLSTGVGENARPIYEKFGFVITGFDEVHNDHLMELALV